MPQITEIQQNPGPPSSVQGEISDGSWVNVLNYNNLLPVPSRIEGSSSRDSLPLESPVLTEMEGTGRLLVWNQGLTLSLPNRLCFWIDNLGDNDSIIQIKVKGEAYPRAIWESQRQKKTEKITALDGGYFETTTIWESVDTISAYGLPEGASLKIYHLHMNLPYEPDPSRPYIHPAYRDQIFPRFWGYNDGLLVEYFYRSHYSGMEYAQSHAIIPAMNVLALEPETFGMFLAAGTTLYYADRREPLPDHLDQALLTEEPFWGLDVAYDIDRPGTVRQVRLAPVAYGGAGQAVAIVFLRADERNSDFLSYYYGWSFLLAHCLLTCDRIVGTTRHQRPRSNPRPRPQRTFFTPFRPLSGPPGTLPQPFPESP